MIKAAVVRCKRMGATGLSRALVILFRVLVHSYWHALEPERVADPPPLAPVLLAYSALPKGWTLHRGRHAAIRCGRIYGGTVPVHEFSPQVAAGRPAEAQAFEEQSMVRFQETQSGVQPPADLHPNVYLIRCFSALDEIVEDLAPSRWNGKVVLAK